MEITLLAVNSQVSGIRKKKSKDATSSVVNAYWLLFFLTNSMKTKTKHINYPSCPFAMIIVCKQKKKKKTIILCSCHYQPATKKLLRK